MSKGGLSSNEDYHSPILPGDSSENSSNNAILARVENGRGAHPSKPTIAPSCLASSRTLDASVYIDAMSGPLISEEAQNDDSLEFEKSEEDSAPSKISTCDPKDRTLPSSIENAIMNPGDKSPLLATDEAACEDANAILSTTSVAERHLHDNKTASSLTGSETLSASISDGPPGMKKLHSLQARNATLQVNLVALINERETLIRQLADLTARAQNGPHNTPSESNCSNDTLSKDEADSILKVAKAVIKEHITLLKRYNEIRDIGLGLMGMIADQRSVRLRDVQEEFEVAPDD